MFGELNFRFDPHHVNVHQTMKIPYVWHNQVINIFIIQEGR